MTAGWRRWWWIIVVLTSGVLFSNCSHRVILPEPNPPLVSTLPTERPSAHMPSDSSDSVYLGLSVQSFEFYKRTGHELIWSRQGELTPQADTLIHFIKTLSYRGLDATQYHYRLIDSLRQSDHNDNTLIRLDACLTDAFLSVGYRLHVGRELDERDTAMSAVLGRAVEKGNLEHELELLEPTARGYRLLKGHLRFLLDSATSKNPNEIEKQRHIISINLDRWRTNPVEGTRYILVNIPSFTLQVVSGDTVVLESAVIVGTPEKPTPVLSSAVECFVTYPFWNVPRKIAIEEYLPIIQRDSMFLARNNFDVLSRNGTLLPPDSVPWKLFTKKYFPVRLRQREGLDNSLGVLKFVFDNPYAVYLHDTNAKGLFKKQVRAFSHGCVRLEKSIELAHYLTTGLVDGRSAEVEMYLKDQVRHVINLAQPMPIYIRYFTSMDVGGKVQHYADVYLRDH